MPEVPAVESSVALLASELYEDWDKLLKNRAKLMTRLGTPQVKFDWPYDVSYEYPPLHSLARAETHLDIAHGKHDAWGSNDLKQLQADHQEAHETQAQDHHHLPLPAPAPAPAAKPAPVRELTTSKKPAAVTSPRKAKPAAKPASADEGTTP